jgi:hypothetical protein
MTKPTSRIVTCTYCPERSRKPRKPVEFPLGRIVTVRTHKQQNAWRRYLAMTGKTED